MLRSPKMQGFALGPRGADLAVQIRGTVAQTCGFDRCRESDTSFDDIKLQSDELESFTHSNVSWESHAAQLETIKEHVNNIGKTIEKLQTLRSSAAPWQQEAIDRIIPVARKLASNTTAAIAHLSPQRLQDPQYQQYLKSNAEAASQRSSMVKDFVECGKTRSTLEALERRLELPR